MLNIILLFVASKYSVLISDVVAAVVHLLFIVDIKT